MPADDGMDNDTIKRIIEAALMTAGHPLSVARLEELFGGEHAPPGRDRIRHALAELGEEWSTRSLELQEVASGFRLQVRAEFEPWIARLWDEKPPRYSRALLETLAIIAYRQPVTRPEIEDIRGVSVSTQIMRTLQERNWIRLVGHRDSPGQPAMFGTTREFLDFFNLKTLDQLPPLAEVRELGTHYPELALEGESGGQETAEVSTRSDDNPGAPTAPDDREAAGAGASSGVDDDSERG